MFRLIFFVISLSIFWGGGQSLYTTLSNSEITEISCKDFLDGKSDKDWFKLSGCFSANSDTIMVYEEGDAGTQSEFFLPLYASAADIGSKPIKAYMELSKSSDKLKIVQLMNAQDSNQDVGKFLDENPEIETFIGRSGVMEISGLRSFGIEADDDTRETLVKNAGNEDFIIIKQNSKPEPLGFSISMLVFGLLILLGIMWYSAREEAAKEGEEEEA